MSYKLLLVKILPRHRVPDFLDGNLYMNTDRYFSEMDTTDLVRFDADEDADEALQISEISIQDKEGGSWVPIGGVINPIVYRSNSKEPINILCMYALTDNVNDCFDERNLNFGDTAIVVKDAKKFVNRFRSAAELAERELHYGPVNYVNKKNYHGPIGSFKKFNDFEYQSEFRFVLSGGNTGPIKFPIGDIRDTCIVCPSSDISKIQALHQNIKLQP